MAKNGVSPKLGGIVLYQEFGREKILQEGFRPGHLTKDIIVGLTEFGRSGWGIVIMESALQGSKTPIEVRDVLLEIDDKLCFVGIGISGLELTASAHSSHIIHAAHSIISATHAIIAHSHIVSTHISHAHVISATIWCETSTGIVWIGSGIFSVGIG